MAIPVRFLKDFKDYMVGDIGFVSDEMAVEMFEKGIVEELESEDLAFIDDEEVEYIDDDEEYYG